MFIKTILNIVFNIIIKKNFQENIDYFFKILNKISKLKKNSLIKLNKNPLESIKAR